MQAEQMQVKVPTRQSNWFNRLPAWILADPGYQQLRQGPRATLQAIANRCDAPPKARPGSLRSQALLACYGGTSLWMQAGCKERALRDHLPILIGLGYVVELSKGGGRDASVYAIPGYQGELDEFAASKTGKRGHWREEDAMRVRAALAQRAIAEAAAQQLSQNGMPAGTDRHGTDGDSAWQGCKNGILPSHVPYSCTIPCTKNDEDAPVRALEEDESRVVLTFPTKGEPPEWELRQSMVDRIQRDFPKVDILGKCKEALRWLEREPGKQVPAAKMPGLLDGYISRGIEKGWCKKVEDSRPEWLRPDPITPEIIEYLKRDCAG